MNARPLHIALVDDDRVYQFTTERMVARIDPEVRFQWFRNGEEALEYLQRHSQHPDILPDILILDINMPYMDGWQFLDAYKNWKLGSAKSVKIYVISSSADERDLLRARSYDDVTDYLEKPITSDILRNVIAQHIETLQRGT